MPQRFRDYDVADTTFLLFRRPLRPIFNVCSDFCNAESGAPCFELVETAQFSKLLFGDGGDPVVEFGDMRKDEAADDERVDNRAAGRWRPIVQAL